MTEPKITYSAKIHEFKEFDDNISTVYGGTYTDKDAVIVDVRIWNNQYGTKSVDEFKDFVLNLSFDDYEDSALLEYIKIIYAGREELSSNISNGILTASFLDDIVISGKANNGKDSDKDNYINLQIVFQADKSLSLKNKDMKSLFLEIVKK